MRSQSKSCTEKDHTHVPEIKSHKAQVAESHPATRNLELRICNWIYYGGINMDARDADHPPEDLISLAKEYDAV